MPDSYKGQTSYAALNYNQNGILKTGLPQGLSTDSYNVYLTVFVYDDANGMTSFNLSQPVQVQPNMAQTLATMTDLTNQNSSSTFVKQMMSENIQMTAQNLMTFTSVMNDMSNNPNYSTTSDLNKRADVRESMASSIMSITITNTASIKLISSMLSVITANNVEISKSMAVR